jgi:hypothetical protein
MTTIGRLGQLFVRRIVFPAIAFLGASMVASLCVSVIVFVIALTGTDQTLTPTSLFSMLMIVLFLGFNIAALAAIPAAGLIWALRYSGARRGRADAVAGGLLGAVMMHIVLHGYDVLTEPPGLSVALFAIAGLIGGIVYWNFAGRPRPPYVFLAL